jgi:hypothetical protein
LIRNLSCEARAGIDLPRMLTPAAVLTIVLSAAAATAAPAATSMCGGAHIPLDTSVLSKPFAQLWLGGVRGNFLLDTGATASRVAMDRYGAREGTELVLSGFTLPLAQGGTFIAADLRSFAAPPGGQLGTVGTDFLSLQPIEFHYEPPQPFATVGNKGCGRDALLRAGLLAVGMPGYYEADASRLKPGMPNVPVIGLRIGTLAFPAQLDTGYGDFPPGIVQVNAALMRALRAAGISAHPLPSDVATVGCSGTHAYERWQIEQAELSIITTEGSIAVRYPPPVLEVKTDTRCGGISHFTEPFAQLGASWLSRWGNSVLDGASSAVWIPARR